MKTCRKCGFEGEESFFAKDSSKKDGYANICKTCNQARAMKYYKKNRSKQLKRMMVTHLANNYRGKYENLQNWGRKRSRKIMDNYGYDSFDKEVTAERNKQFVGNIILVRGTNEILQV